MRSNNHFKDRQSQQYHGRNSIWSKLKFHKKHHQHLKKPQQKHQPMHHQQKEKQLHLKERLHQLLKEKHHQQKLLQHPNLSLKLFNKLLNLVNMFSFVIIRNTSSEDYQSAD